MAKDIIVHELGNTQILHRSSDGYMNATAMCKAAGKLIADYRRLEGTGDYLQALEADMGITISQLIPVLGTPTNATQDDVDKFWKSRVRRASENLSRVADRMGSAA